MTDNTSANKPPESPPTERELDLNDDDETLPRADGTAAVPQPAKSPKPGVRFTEEATEIPPPQPPRPVSAQQQAENTLIEAFPNIDKAVVKAVLVASGGKVEPAFNALLSMSDPSFQAEESPPPRPPRPQRTQLEQDEIYARQLAEHYESQAQAQAQGGQEEYQQRRQQGAARRRQGDERPENERSFFDDELPEIRKNIEQGFKETQKTVNSWITKLSKKLDGGPEEYDQYGNVVHRDQAATQPSQQRQNFGPSQSDQLYGIRRSAEQRRSADHNRYDADNTVLSNDFAQLEMRDNDGPQRSNRPTANPDLFKPTPVAPPQTGPVDEVDALHQNPSPNNQAGANKTGGKKWQPLTSVAPHPEPGDHDPFSLGDSEDEESKVKDSNPEDSQRLKKAAAAKEAPAASNLKPAQRSGSVGQIDADAAAILKDTK